jgi:nucleoside-diphosphate kinase
MERSLIILKPDCMESRQAGTVIERFERSGFEIAACKMITLAPETLREHYAHVADKPFYPEIEAFMGSRPVIVMILKGEQVIDRVREILGPTDSTEAAPGTIRGDLGTDKMRNIAHASDGPETAAAEIKRFFSADEIFG